MGAQQSSESLPSKLTLAEKRYHINGLRRRSTRKTGNVTRNGCDMSFNVPLHKSSTELSSTSTEVASKAESVDCLNENLKEFDERLINLFPQHFQQKSLSSTTLNKSGGTIAANQILLTRTQRVLIENSWKFCEKTGSSSVGALIFQSVLISQPNIKLLFGLEKIPQGRLKYDLRFRKHASLLTCTIGYAVKNLVYTEKLAKYFQALGKKHYSMQGGRTFHEKYWNAFSETTFISSIEESDKGPRCKETMSSWRCLINFIIQQMRKGFDEENTLRTSLTDSENSNVQLSNNNENLPSRLKQEATNTICTFSLEPTPFITKSSLTANQSDNALFTKKTFQISNRDRSFSFPFITCYLAFNERKTKNNNQKNFHKNEIENCSRLPTFKQQQQQQKQHRSASCDALFARRRLQIIS